MLDRVSKNRWGYIGYLVITFFSVAALIVIGAVLASGDPQWASAAYVLFAVVVVGYGVLFAYELCTTIRQMNALERGFTRDR